MCHRQYEHRATAIVSCATAVVSLDPASDTSLTRFCHIIAKFFKNICMCKIYALYLRDFYTKMLFDI